MKRFLGIIFVLALLAFAAGCGGDNGGGDGDAAGGDGGGEGGGPKVGFIYVSPLQGSAWTQAWDNARQHVEEKLGAETSVVEPIAENADVVGVMNDLIREGNEVIVGTAFGYQPFIAQVAEQNPEVSFVAIGPWAQEEEAPENVATVYGNLWEVRYVTGVVAGMMTESDKLGFVSAFSIPSVVAGINGFQLGAASVNPDATTNVVLTNSWYDPPRATQAAQSLADKGIDVVAQHEDSTGTLLGARKADIWGVGSEADTSDAAPTHYLTGSIYNWNDYLEDKVQQHMDGSFEGDETNGDLKSGLVQVGPLNSDVPDDVRAKAEEVEEQLKSGELVVFKGPLEDNEGNTVLEKGEEWAEPADVYENMTFFVEGIIGKVEK